MVTSSYPTLIKQTLIGLDCLLFDLHLNFDATVKLIHIEYALYVYSTEHINLP